MWMCGVAIVKSLACVCVPCNKRLVCISNGTLAHPQGRRFAAPFLTHFLDKKQNKTNLIHFPFLMF